MATIARLFDFIPGDVIRSADVDSEFNQLVNLLNGTSQNLQTSLQLNDGSLAALLVNQVTATSGSRIQSWKAAGAEKAYFDGLGTLQSTVVGDGVTAPSAETGLSPIVVTSTKKCTNLNADYLRGLTAQDIITQAGLGTTGNITITDPAPMLTFNDTTVGALGEDVELVLNDDGTDQQLTLRRKSDAKKIQRWNVTQGSAQFHSVVSCRSDAGSDIDITQSVGASDPNQHLTTKRYVDDKVAAGAGALTLFDPASTRLLQCYVKPAGTVVTRPTLAEDGLSTVGNALTNDDDANAAWVKGTSNAVNTAREGLVSTATILQTRWDGEITFRVKFPSISVIRIFVGISTQDISALGSSTPNDQCALFRYDTGVDGTAFWRTYTAGGAVSTVTTTTKAIVADTMYRLRIRWTGAGTSVKFYVDDIIVATHTTNLPTIGTSLGFSLTLQTLEAVAKSIKFSYAGAWMK